MAIPKLFSSLESLYSFYVLYLWHFSFVGIPALVKQASDRRIIDPAGTSHAQKKANVFR